MVVFVEVGRSVPHCLNMVVNCLQEVSENYEGGRCDEGELCYKRFGSLSLSRGCWSGVLCPCIVRFERVLGRWQDCERAH